MTAFPETVERVGVVGAGVIGASWASLFLAAGKNVDLFDPAPNAESDTRRYIETAWPSLVQLGLVKAGAAPERISFVGDVASAVAAAQFVQESVPERLAVKHEIYERIEVALPPDALVATSSSGLLLSDLQAVWRDPSRTILGHPFNPPHLIPLVELLGNERTAPGALDFAEAFYESCGKVTIRVNKEVPGSCRQSAASRALAGSDRSRSPGRGKRRRCRQGGDRGSRSALVGHGAAHAVQPRQRRCRHGGLLRPLPRELPPLVG